MSLLAALAIELSGKRGTHSFGRVLHRPRHWLKLGIGRGGFGGCCRSSVDQYSVDSLKA